MRRVVLLAVLAGVAVFAAPFATAKAPPPGGGGGKAPSFGADLVLPGRDLRADPRVYRA